MKFSEQHKQHKQITLVTQEKKSIENTLLRCKTQENTWKYLKKSVYDLRTLKSTQYNQKKITNETLSMQSKHFQRCRQLPPDLGGAPQGSTDLAWVCWGHRWGMVLPLKTSRKVMKSPEKCVCTLFLSVLLEGLRSYWTSVCLSIIYTTCIFMLLACSWIWNDAGTFRRTLHHRSLVHKFIGLSEPRCQQCQISFGEP